MLKLKIVVAVEGQSDLVNVTPLVALMRRSPEIDPILVLAEQVRGEMAINGLHRDLRSSEPDFRLEIEAASSARQTAAMMEAFAETFDCTNPDLVMVAGNANSAVAASMTAVKMGIPVAHLDAGLRTPGREASEEVNSVMTDAIANFHFVSEPSAANNLAGEGIPTSSISFCGSMMVDALVANSAQMMQSTVYEDLGLEPGTYAVLALRQVSELCAWKDVDGFLRAIAKVQACLPMICIADVRSVAKLHQFGLWQSLHELPNLKTVDPLEYVDYLALLQGARLTVTDASCVQEATTCLAVPCLTLAWKTERPVTVSHGTNVLVGRDPAIIVAEAMRVLRGDAKHGSLPAMWDGKASERIVSQLLKSRERVVDLYRDLRGRRSVWRSAADHLSELHGPTF